MAIVSDIQQALLIKKDTNIVVKIYDNWRISFSIIIFDIDFETLETLFRRENNDERTLSAIKYARNNATGENFFVEFPKRIV